MTVEVKGIRVDSALKAEIKQTIVTDMSNGRCGDALTKRVAYVMEAYKVEEATCALLSTLGGLIQQADPQFRSELAAACAELLVEGAGVTAQADRHGAARG